MASLNSLFVQGVRNHAKSRAATASQDMFNGERDFQTSSELPLNFRRMFTKASFDAQLGQYGAQERETLHLLAQNEYLLSLMLVLIKEILYNHWMITSSLDLFPA
jgi:hypothetical protein